MRGRICLMEDLESRALFTWFESLYMLGTTVYSRYNSEHLRGYLISRRGLYHFLGGQDLQKAAANDIISHQRTDQCNKKSRFITIIER